MGMFDNQPRTPKVRQHYDKDNFFGVMVSICIITIAILLGGVLFALNYDRALSPAEAKEKTEQERIKIEHKEKLLDMCEKIKDDKKMVECMGKVESGYYD